MVYSLTYRRPSYVASDTSSLSGEAKQRSINSDTSTMSNGIPPELALDRIIEGGTCPPVSLREFLNFLKYVEHSAENLQFYLWFRDYSKRFEELPANERVLSPVWDASSVAKETKVRPASITPDTAAAFQGTTFSNTGKTEAHSDDGDSPDPFNTPPRTPRADAKRPGASIDSDAPSMTSGGEKVDHNARAAAAFQKAGLTIPMTIQPYREEINRIVSIYIADKGPRQLNISSTERSNLMRALENTTHPSAFNEVMVTVDWSLRNQGHVNFVRWSVENGNDSRKVFARWLGIFCIFGALVAEIILTLSDAGRAFRVIPLVLMFLGVATLAAAVHGMCVVLHGLHHRHLRPWELFFNDDEAGAEMKAKEVSCDSLDSQVTSNSWEDEPWVARYQKRNLIRKIFDREVWIQEPALRQIQDTIFLQALIIGFVCSCITAAIFVAVPKGNYF